MQVRISAISIGGNADLFDIYQDYDGYTTPVATGVSRNDILSGYTVTIDDTTTIVKLISSGGVCNGRETQISVTPPGTITVQNSEDIIGAAVTSVSKNDSPYISAFSGNGNFASGVIYENEEFYGNVSADDYGSVSLIVNSSTRGPLFTGNSGNNYGPSVTSGTYIREAGENISITGSFLSSTPPEPCFVAGTMIKLADGTEAAIETLSVGVELESALIDTLEDTNDFNVLHAWSSNNLIETRTTSKISVFSPEEVYRTIKVNNGLLQATYNHIQPARVNGIWKMIRIENLAVGDVLYDINGNLIDVTSIEIITEPTTVYKLTLSDTSHTYFANNILTHNIKQQP